MGKETFTQKLKHFVYTLILPIYLWSIGHRSLEEYIMGIEREYERSIIEKATSVTNTTKE